MGQITLASPWFGLQEPVQLEECALTWAQSVRSLSLYYKLEVHGDARCRGAASLDADPEISQFCPGGLGGMSTRTGRSGM